MGSRLRFMPPRWLRWPTASLRNYLTVMTLVAAVPISALMAYNLFDQIRSQDRRLYEGMQRASGMLAQSVSRELNATIDTLTLLSYSVELQRFLPFSFEEAVFRRRLWRESWHSVYLRSAQGAVLFDTDRPGKPSAGEHAAASGLPVMEISRPVVSGLIPAGERWPAHTTVEVPVMINNTASYVLGVRIPARAWQELIDSAGLNPSDLSVLYDGDWRITAHSEQPGQLVGQRETVNLALLSARPLGTGHFRSGDGQYSYVAWETLPVAGWRVLVGTPSAPIDQAYYQSILAALGTILACLLLGVTLALLVSRQMTRPLGLLAGNKLNRLEGRIPVREIAQLRDALSAARRQDEHAHAVIRRNRDEISRRMAEFETLFASCPIGLSFAEDRACLSVQHNVAMQAIFRTHVGTGVQPQVKFLHQGRSLQMEELPLQRAAARGEPTYGMELEIRVEGRAPAFAIVNAVPLRDAQGSSRGAISAAVDITTRKQAEARLILAEQRLRESQHLIDLAQESGQVGFFHYRVDNGKFSWTPGQAGLFGFLDESGLERLRTWTRRISRGSWIRFGRLLIDALRQRHDVANIEYCVFLPDGEAVWLSSRVRLIYGTHGRLEHVIGVTLDMTEQKNAERERSQLIAWEKEARIQAEKANRAKDEFLAMLGHELRNPLAAIASGVEVLNRVEGDSDVARSARRIIERQTRHLAHMMDDLMDVARVLSGQKVEMAPLELSCLVQRVISSMQMAGGFDKHALESCFEEVWVSGNPIRIEQIVTNLLTNATKYTPAGGRIVVRVMPRDGRAMLEVEDNGVGIPDELLPRVFDLFVQGERTLDRRQGGMGIGLTLVQRLVEMHRGQIAVRDAGPGTIMSVLLPAIDAPGKTRAEVTSPRSRPQRIVVVEDNADVLEGLQTALALEGHSVRTARDGVSGLALILAEKPDVAIVDVGLPGLTGYELAQRARQAGFSGRLLAVSGYGRARDRKLAGEAGFDRHFLKPVRSADLVAAINAG
ncbi:ATP-binding protein [Uliginosibacterium paludis]|uniref:histidine kinase n=1 Tax=Uliginosibacterium paludis TaxID=1615952 RepID=A0ABV2CUD6_9RHOO